MRRAFGFFVLVASGALSGGCGSGEVQGAGPSGDGVSGAADDWRDSAACASDRECDDGLYCNGSEKCDQGFCRAGTLVTCGDRVDCTRDACNETNDECEHTPNHAACDEGVCDAASGCGEGQVCANDDDCDDDVFCNGVERCGGDGRCIGGEPVACDDGNDCTVDQCSEQGRVCTHEMRDADGDGHGDAACRGGDDCDDDDRAVRPGAREVCDDGHDNDCDRLRDCSDPACEDTAACNEDDDRDRDRDEADRDDRDDRADRDDRDRDRDDREVDPCLQNGWYNDGDCDDVCARRDPDCDRRRDACEDRDWYRDGICDDSCRRQDPDCPARNDDGCRYANDGVCDEPSGACAAGTDTSDCRPDQARRGADSCRYANDGVCDERTYCIRGTDGRDCTDGGANSCYWANDGHCDAAPTCAAGTDRNDCAGAGQGGGADPRQGVGVCGGLTYQGRCADTDTIEFCLNKGQADERVQRTDCADGRVCRWQDAQTGYMCLAPAAGDGAGQGSRSVPAAWTCSDSFYDAGDDCDCDCGAYDPDCDSPWLRILNCEDGQTCGEDGECTGEAEQDDVPAGWSCSDSWYDADDGCDCNCGVRDPDCSDANARLYHCAEGQTCSAAGRCEGGAGDDEGDDEDEDGAPAGWTCAASWYDAGDGCDCGCGVRDPDCADPDATVYHCAAGQTCDFSGECVDADGGDVPAGWTCLDSWYGDEQCDCDCGAADEDCSYDECEDDAGGAGVPSGWTCNDAYYGAGDGCDCDCGDYDPDCDDAGAQVFNCGEGQTCGWDGTCEDEAQWI